jgi:glycosyltransferase involved in cell wall biosynthesis
MKIGIDARFYGPTHAGLGRYTKNLVDQLTHIDNDNEYVIFLHTSNADEFTTNNPRFSKRIVSAGHYSVKEQLTLPALLQKEQLDLMHFPHLNVPLGYRGRYVVTIHDLIMHKFKNRAVTTKVRPIYETKHLAYRLITRWAATHAAAVIVPSKAVKGELMEFYKLPNDKVVVTYEAADDNKRESRHGEVNRSMILNKYAIAKPFIMYVGNVYPHKNIELLARAMKDLHVRYGLSLILPSARSIFLQRTEQMMKDYHVRDWVVLPGYVPDQDLRVLYSQAEAYVFPSLSEGFGLPPLEAMAAGLPVVCSDIPVLREVCGDAALFIDPHDPQSVVEQVGRLMADKRLRQTMIDRGLAREKLFSWQKMAEETVAVYESVIKLKKRAVQPLL